MKIVFFLIVILASALYISAQTNQARRIDKFGELNCEDLMARTDSVIQSLKEQPNAKAFIIFYEGKHTFPAYHKKTKKPEWKSFNPRRSEARNRTKAITLYATKWRKMPKDRFVIVDGGYDISYRVEIWIVPQDVEPPPPTPTLTEKDIKFRKGRPFAVRDCQKFYSDL